MPDSRPALGFDTSAAHCAAALVSGEAVIAVRAEAMARGQAEALMPMLEALLAEADLGWRELGVIGVGIGPGSFTGTRIAVAAARGLALGLAIPAVGVCSLEAVALGQPRPFEARLLLRVGEVALQRFTDTGAGPIETRPGEAPALDPADLATAIARIADARRAEPGPRPAPIYLRPADAAPARDRGPVMLPG